MGTSSCAPQYITVQMFSCQRSTTCPECRGLRCCTQPARQPSHRVMGTVTPDTGSGSTRMFVVRSAIRAIGHFSSLGRWHSPWADSTEVNHLDFDLAVNVRHILHGVIVLWAILRKPVCPSHLQASPSCLESLVKNTLTLGFHYKCRLHKSWHNDECHVSCCTHATYMTPLIKGTSRCLLRQVEGHHIKQGPQGDRATRAKCAKTWTVGHNFRLQNCAGQCSSARREDAIPDEPCWPEGALCTWTFRMQHMLIHTWIMTPFSDACCTTTLQSAVDSLSRPI